jgi:DNA invertase Pin-like site-specific DNA recombinase
MKVPFRESNPRYSDRLPGGNAIDTTNAAGRFMFVVLAGPAGMERNLTRERTRSAMAVKRGNGQRIGTLPYGYDLAGDPRASVPNEPEQAVIADIRSQRSAGRTLERIAQEWSARGVATKTGKSDRWTHQAVARILKRERPFPTDCRGTTASEGGRVTSATV